jgi:hypothetical protein
VTLIEEGLIANVSAANARARCQRDAAHARQRMGKRLIARHFLLSRRAPRSLPPRSQDAPTERLPAAGGAAAALCLLPAFGGLGRPPNGAWGCPRAISNPDAAQRSSAATKRERKRRPVSGHPAITPGGETFSRTRAVDLA